MRGIPDTERGPFGLLATSTDLYQIQSNIWTGDFDRVIHLLSSGPVVQTPVGSPGGDRIQRVNMSIMSAVGKGYLIKNRSDPKM